MTNPICPNCKSSTTRHKGAYGEFLECSNCKEKVNILFIKEYRDYTKENYVPKPKSKHKLSFFQVECSREEITINGETYQKTKDEVIVHIATEVDTQAMQGIFIEEYSIDIESIPNLFNTKITFPEIQSFDARERILAVTNFLKPYIGKECKKESIKQNNKNIITEITFVDIT